MAFLTTKFFIPRSSTGMVQRPRLMERLNQVFDRPLTLVSAPPGFGKTTLLAAWARQREPETVPTCWLALDEADNDPARYWAYLIEALRPLFQRSSVAGDFERILGLLDNHTLPSAGVLLDALINAAARLEAGGVLVLDDYHLITQPEIQEGMIYLVEHLPPTLHLVIATRADPPLPLARFRARGHLLELRAADLRFALLEAEALLEKMTGIPLPPNALSALETSTEGWAAGLQMAALALSGMAASGGPLPTAQIQAFIDSFSGKHHFVLDYLAEEVFNRQPSDIQAFLLATSVLDRFSAALCAAVTSDTLPGQRVMKEGSRFSQNSSMDTALLLEHLQKHNLFLIPLDEERTWFRYHRLFMDLLRQRLQQTAPEQVPLLHRRASAWFEGQGITGDAIRHALAGEDWQRAARLLDAHVEEYIQHGQLSTVMGWVRVLPPSVVDDQPRLGVRLVWALALANRLQEAGAMTQPILNALDRGVIADPLEASLLRGNLLMLQAFSLVSSGEPGQALQVLETAAQQIPESAVREWSWLYWMRGYSLRYQNDLAGAEKDFQSAVRLAKSTEGSSVDSWKLMVFLTDLAIVEEQWGHKRRAEAIYREALALGERRAHGYLSRVEAGIAQILIYQNRLEEALDHCKTALEWSGWWPSSNHRVLALVMLAWVQLEQGDLAGAAESLHQADEERQQSRVLAANDSFFDGVRMKLWLANGEREAAARWADQQVIGGLRELPLNTVSEGRMIAVARARMAQGQMTEAAEWLSRAEAGARAAGRTNTLIETLALKALAFQLATAQNDPHAAANGDALNCLEESLRLAGDEGYALIYRDSGEPMRALLNALAARKRDLAGAVRQMLAHFPAEGDLDLLTRSPAKALLPEPLTEREQEVLRLMAQGMSNAEMAGQLVVSVGTIKTHVHNLIAKLDAQSRTHAVAKARELGIV